MSNNHPLGKERIAVINAKLNSDYERISTEIIRLERKIKEDENKSEEDENRLKGLIKERDEITYYKSCLSLGYDVYLKSIARYDVLD